MFFIRDREVGPNHEPYVIAEACINHEGSITLAREMVHAAHEAGVSAIKFQLHVIDDEMLRSAPQSDNFEIPLHEALENTNLSIDEHLELKDLCHSLSFDYLCTPFSRASADILRHEIGVSVFKVGSGELTNIPYQRHLAQTGVPLIVSTGMSEIHEIDETVALHLSHNVTLALMHCVSIYPCPYNRVNLGFIPKMIARYGVPVGLSCHTPSVYTAFGAVALGASLIEKHFTLDRSRKGPDHASSLEPVELTQLVEGVRAIFDARGEERRIFPEEQQIVAWARESVVSVVDIPAGTVITTNMIHAKRPSPEEGAIPARSFDEVIGRKARNKIEGDRQVKWEDIE